MKLEKRGCNKSPWLRSSEMCFLLENRTMLTRAGDKKTSFKVDMVA